MNSNVELDKQISLCENLSTDVRADASDSIASASADKVLSSVSGSSSYMHTDILADISAKLDSIPVLELTLKKLSDALSDACAKIDLQNIQLEYFKRSYDGLVTECRSISDKLSQVIQGNDWMVERVAKATITADAQELVEFQHNYTYSNTHTDALSDTIQHINNTIEQAVHTPLTTVHNKRRRKRNNKNKNRKQKSPSTLISPVSLPSHTLNKDTPTSHSPTAAPAATVRVTAGTARAEKPLLEGDRDAATAASLVVSCPVICENESLGLEAVAHATLAGVYPSLQVSDIVSVTQLKSRKRVSAAPDRLPRSDGPTGDTTLTNSTDVASSPSMDAPCLSLIVHFADDQTSRRILAAKHKLTSITAADINYTALGPAVTILPNAKVFINEYLPNSIYKTFQTIKKEAKGLGFKYVWHRNAKFWVKWASGSPAHSVMTSPELINTALIYRPSIPSTTLGNAAN